MSAAVQSAAARRRHAAAVSDAGRVEVDEIDEQFRADTTDETLRMPVTGRTSA